jgi:hypothetical protein
MTLFARNVEGTKLEGDRGVTNYLAQGNLSSALATAKGAPRIAVLVACSDGATAEQLANGAIGPDKIPSDVAIYSYALALREGRDASPFRMLARDWDERQTFDFVDQVHNAAADALLSITPPVDLRARGVAYAAATVLLGDATPLPWRDAAKRTLFVVERPYFK